MINLVDEVTQWQHVGAVPAISEHLLVPVLEALIEACPQAVPGFHSDNGSEFVNRVMLKLLNKLHVEFTRSRPRRSNDNALVEGKNGSVIRKVPGHDHIPRHFAEAGDRFAREVLSPGLNYHRPCLFPEERRDGKGRIRRHYPDRNPATPYQKLKSLPQAERHLRPGATFADLDAIAHAQNDVEAAAAMHRARDRLTGVIHSAQST